MACAVCLPVLFTTALMPRLSTLKAVIPTLMAELTAWSVACPAAAPYLHQKSRVVERSEQGVGKRFGVGEGGC